MRRARTNRRESEETLQIIGVALIAIAFGLFVARDTVIRLVTSKPLGSLAPGFASTRTGFGIYAGLIGDFGLVVFALGVGTVFLVVASIALFVFGSILAIVGEVIVFRNLKR